MTLSRIEAAALKMAVLASLWLQAGVIAAEEPLTRADVFVSGTEGYHTYRIPRANAN